MPGLSFSKAAAHFSIWHLPHKISSLSGCPNSIYPIFFYSSSFISRRANCQTCILTDQQDTECIVKWRCLEAMSATHPSLGRGLLCQAGPGYHCAFCRGSQIIHSLQKAITISVQELCTSRWIHTSNLALPSLLDEAQPPHLVQEETPGYRQGGDIYHCLSKRIQ